MKVFSHLPQNHCNYLVLHQWSPETVLQHFPVAEKNICIYTCIVSSRVQEQLKPAYRWLLLLKVFVAKKTFHSTVIVLKAKLNKLNKQKEVAFGCLHLEYTDQNTTYSNVMYVWTFKLHFQQGHELNWLQSALKRAFATWKHYVLSKSIPLYDILLRHTHKPRQD